MVTGQVIYNEKGTLLWLLPQHIHTLIDVFTTDSLLNLNPKSYSRLTLSLRVKFLFEKNEQRG